MSDVINNNRQKKIVSWVGMLLIAVSLVFIVNRFLEADLDFAILASPQVIAGLVAISFAYSIVFIATAVNYRAWIYNVSGFKIPYPPAISIYCSANLYKYIPGSVLTIVGRNRLAVEYSGLSHGKVAFSTLLEGSFFVVAVIITTLVFSFEYAADGISQINFSPIVTAIIIGILVVVALIIFLTRRRIGKFFKDIGEIGTLKPLALAKRFITALLLATAWGSTFLLILVLMGQPMDVRLALTVIGLFNLSWLVGFAIPIAPAGLGIREAATFVLFGGVVDEGFLLLAIMAHRVIAITSDVMAYCIAICYARVKKE